MKCWKSTVLLVGFALLSGCGSDNGSSTVNVNTTSPAPLTFYQHTAVFLNNTTVYVWGANESGQIGNGTNSFSSIPVRVARFANYSAGNGVSTGSSHTLAFQKYSTIRAWGFNGFGQLGNGVTADNQTPNSLVPVTVRKKGSPAPLSGVISAAAGGYFSLALDRSGQLWSWGSNAFGQLGRQPQVINSIFVPMSSQTADRVQTGVNGSPFTGVRAVSAGGSHALALDSSGTVWGWGWNGFGQVGDGSATNSSRFYPVQLTFTDDPPRAVTITKIAAGGSHSLALDSLGNIWAWGYNYFGQLGNGQSGDNAYSPTPVKLTSPVLSSSALIAAGLDHSLAYDPVSDTLYSWGYNIYGQLGTSTTSNSSSPLLVKDPVNVINNFQLRAVTGSLPASITAVGHHSHARKIDGSWWSWGDNASGQLGVGSLTNSSVPARVIGF